MDYIFTHINADFDAIASLLAAHKLYPEAQPVLPKRLNHNVHEFVSLYKNGLPFITWDDLTHLNNFENILIVDTQSIPQHPGITDNTTIHIIDHHPRKQDLNASGEVTIEQIGANTTLMVERLRKRRIEVVDTLEATLMALGIYEDTGSLTYNATTPRDVNAASWLLSKHAALDTLRRFLMPPLNDAQQKVFEHLLTSAENRTIHGYSVIVAACESDVYVDQINSVTHKLRDMLDPQALFVAVAMPGGVQLVCRANSYVVDAGEIARAFGGGGHNTAAAAHIDDMPLVAIIEKLWQEITPRIQPITMLSDIMSYGVQTVDANQPITAVIQQIRKIGHEGYPVLNDGHVVGLLTIRDADRAIEHGMERVKVRDIMNSGDIALKPYDSISTLEQTIVNSGWGQIPIINDQNALIGIVTRTDLIKHWSNVHPTTATRFPKIDTTRIKTILGDDIAALVQTIAQHADDNGINLYMVGGTVRDLLLNRSNYDVDFVVEGDAIHFAQTLSERFGGEINSFRPFGTAKWKITPQVANNLSLTSNGDKSIDSVDFATSRNEFYAHPTALPTVYTGSIKLDLHRRDFTINTLAVQLSPASMMGHILDFYNGLNDLNRKTIRVLHSLSFIDDPTRILRAVRFEQRLNFHIEPRTEELIITALPVLQRITGERLRNELTLLLKEPEPAQGLLKLAHRNILTNIHPDFILPDNIAALFDAIPAAIDQPLIDTPTPPDSTDLMWHLVFSAIHPESLPSVCERLLFSKPLTNAYVHANRLLHTPDEHMTQPDSRPSQIVNTLHAVPLTALITVLIVSQNTTITQYIRDYLKTWQHTKPSATGKTLKKLGLQPGPIYSRILDRLQTAWLDGEIHSQIEEDTLLEQLVREYNDDNSRTQHL